MVALGRFGRWSELKSLAWLLLVGLVALGLCRMDQRKKRQSHASHRYGRISSPARTDSTIPLVLDLRTWALRQSGHQIDTAALFREGRNDNSAASLDLRIDAFPYRRFAYTLSPGRVLVHRVKPPKAHQAGLLKSAAARAGKRASRKCGREKVLRRAAAADGRLWVGMNLSPNAQARRPDKRRSRRMHRPG